MAKKLKRLQQINENEMSDHFLMLENGTLRSERYKNCMPECDSGDRKMRDAKKNSVLSNFNGVHLITRFATKKKAREREDTLTPDS